MEDATQGADVPLAVLLDRDGTLIEHVPYLTDPAQVTLVPGAAEALRRLAAVGIPVAVCTNQPVIGRGVASSAEVEEVNAEMCRQLAEQGAHLDTVFYCPHHQDAGCACRKPAPGLGIAAAESFGVEPAGCAVIGDTMVDVRFARALNARAVLVPGAGTGTGTGRPDRGEPAEPDFVASDLLDAIAWLLGDSRSSRLSAHG